MAEVVSILELYFWDPVQFPAGKMNIFRFYLCCRCFCESFHMHAATSAAVAVFPDAIGGVAEFRVWGTG